MTKQEILDAIARRIGGTFEAARGSTEPKAVVDAINEHFRLGIDARLSKPEIAERIATAAGVAWDASCDSRNTPSGGGSTITRIGLARLLEATDALGARRA